MKLGLRSFQRCKIPHIFLFGFQFFGPKHTQAIRKVGSRVYSITVGGNLANFDVLTPPKYFVDINGFGWSTLSSLMS